MPSVHLLAKLRSLEGRVLQLVTFVRDVARALVLGLGTEVSLRPLGNLKLHCCIDRSESFGILQSYPRRNISGREDLATRRKS